MTEQHENQAKRPAQTQTDVTTLSPSADSPAEGTDVDQIMKEIYDPTHYVAESGGDGET